VYEEQLSDPAKAIEVLGQALGVRTVDRQVLASLNRLYRAERMWPELLDNLKLQAQSAESPEERTRLRKEVGQLLAEKLASYEEALDAYRVVLEETPGDDEAVAAVRGIAEQHEQMRAAVADILVPVLRSAERWADLASVLETRLSIETDPSQRTETLRSIADVLENRLRQPAEAQKALLRALTEAPEATDLHEQIERLAALCDGWVRYADALAERGSAVFEPALGKDIYTRLGRVAEQHLADDARAISAYTRALEMAGDESVLLEALDRLYTKTRDAGMLADVLERRGAITADAAEQAELNYRLSVVYIHDFHEPGRGLGALRTTLERAPGHQAATLELEKLLGERDYFEEAAEILEGVYRSRNQHADLARLYAKRVDFAETSSEKSDRRRELARVLEEECSDAPAAQRVLERGLIDDPTDPVALGELERLASVTGDWQAASAALEKALSDNPDLGSDTGRELWVRLATWVRDKAKDPLAAERALLKALDLAPTNDEVLVLLEELQRAPGRERELVATLRRRARLQPNDQEREQLMQRAKGLADELRDPTLTEEILRELVELDEANLWALEQLTRLREAAGDYAETFTLLVKRSEVQLEGETVRELRHRAAAIARDQLGKPNEAIQLYEALFDDRPGDEVAAKALRELYQSTQHWLDLGRLIDRLIDQADTPSERSALRIELAQLNEQQYGASDTAIALLHAVLDEQPGHGDAVVTLSQLLEKTERDEELAELLSSQIDAARARADTEAELRFHVRLGQVYESRLKDRSRAIDTYRDVLARDPQHREALQALARLHQGAEDHAEAAAVLEKLLELSQAEEAVQWAGVLANEYGKLGDADAAARALERGLMADEKNAGLRSRLRGLYQSRQAWDKLATLVARDADFADSPPAKVLLLREAAGIQSGRRRDHAAAAELLEKATALMPGDRELLLQLCDAYSASGRGSAAAEVLEKVVESYGVKRTKELADVHRRLADAYVADGKTGKALEELDKAFRIEPGNIHVLKKLGEVALQAGDAKRAQQMFRALLLQKLEGNAPITKAEVFFNLGEVHLKLGEKDKAKQMYERAVQADAELARAKERLAELRS
jgi:Tfp pilus assembly protein PilF